MHGDLEQKSGDVVFHPIKPEEVCRRQNIGMNLQQLGLGPRHYTYACGACGNTTNGRVVCELKRQHDTSSILWCLCSCDKEEPSVLIMDHAAIKTQVPIARTFHSSSEWPVALATLYDEAAKAHAAGAYTATSMVCRKILMACACDKGDTDGKHFGPYVDYITQQVLTYPAAKSAIDAIRTIGNEANHNVQIVNEPDATRAMKIVTYMLNTIYSLPIA